MEKNIEMCKKMEKNWDLFKIFSIEKEIIIRHY